VTRALFWISLLTLVVLGATHSAIGLASFEPLSANLVWFLGSGFALLLHAALNLARWRARHSDRLVHRLVHSANVLMTGFGILAVRAVPEPHAYVVLAALAGLLLSSLVADREAAARLNPGPQSNEPSAEATV